MPITKEFLESEIQNLKLQREQLLANANAALGAIQGYEALLAKLNVEDLQQEESNGE